jgi:hypothetical protein
LDRSIETLNELKIDKDDAKEKSQIKGLDSWVYSEGIEDFFERTILEYIRKMYSEEVEFRL